MRDGVLSDLYLPRMTQGEPFTTDTSNAFKYLFHDAIIAQNAAYVYLRKKGGEKRIWQA